MPVKKLYLQENINIYKLPIISFKHVLMDRS
jgi:hypothetical protein